jgi:hypothetical protein
MLQKSRPEQVKTELGAIALCIAANLGFLLGSAATRGRFTPVEFWCFFIWGEVWFTGIMIWMLRHHLTLWQIKATREAYKDRIEIHERFSKLSKPDELPLLIESLIETATALQILLMDFDGTPPVADDHPDHDSKNNGATGNNETGKDDI